MKIKVNLWVVLLLSLLSPSLFSQTTINQLIGVNADARDPINRVKKFSIVRNYHDAIKDHGEDNAASVIDCTSDFKLAWNPSNDNSDFYSFDEFYAALKNKVSPSLKGAIPQSIGVAQYNGQALEAKPICNTAMHNQFISVPPGPNYLIDLENTGGGDMTDPSWYVQYTKWITLYVARYGSINFDGTQFESEFYEKNLALGEPVETGKQLVSFLEPSNEPDKSWYDGTTVSDNQNSTPEDPIAIYYFAPEQYAALVSAIYDGHGSSPAFQIPNVSNAFLGMKNTDPNMKFVLAGLAEMRGAYLERMITWFKDHRKPGTGNYGFDEGTPIPFDVINFHHYSTELSATIQTEQAFEALTYDNLTKVPINFTADAVSPEADKLKDKIGWFIELLEAFDGPSISNKEFWYTEFGYDSEGTASSGVNVPSSPNHCISDQDVQADLLIRTVLEVSAAQSASSQKGVDKATIFNLTNDPNQGINSYNSSGLLDDFDNPKKSWYSVMTLKNTIGTYEFESDDPNITVDANNNTTGAAPRIYKYTNGNKVAYAIWSPTTNKQPYTVNVSFSPDYASSITKGYFVKMKDLSEIGTKVDNTDKIINNVVTELPVSESPIFFFPNGSVPNFSFIKPTEMVPSAYNVESLCCNGVKLSYKAQPTSTPSLPARVRIYYAEVNEYHEALGLPPNVSNVNDGLEFDLGLTKMLTNGEITQVIKLHTESGNNSSTIINGLEPSTEYWFWVIPYDYFGNITVNTERVSCDSNSDLATLHTRGTVGGCPTSDCIIEIPKDWITTSHPTITNLVDNVDDMFVVSSNQQSCGALSDNTVSNNYLDAWWNYDPNTTVNEYWAIINFQENVTIDAMYWLDGYSMGDMKVEYQYCNCNYWFDWTTLTTNKAAEWRSFLPNRRTVRKLRFTKTSEGAEIEKIRFCGSFSECHDNKMFGPYDPPSELIAKDVSYREASLGWIPATENLYEYNEPYDPRVEPRVISSAVDDYDIYYNETANWDAVLENNLRTTSNVPLVDLENLKKGTTYTAKIKIARPFPCYITQWPNAVKLVSNPINFTTKSDNEPNLRKVSEESEVNVLKGKIEITPNPAKDFIKIGLPEGAIKHLNIYNNNGDLMHSVSIVENQREVVINDISKFLAQGIYFVKVQMVGKQSLVEKFIVIP